MSFDDFYTAFEGAFVIDGYMTPQCVALVLRWSKVIGGPRFWGNAEDIFQQAGTFYTQVINTPDAVPEKGDIIIWSSVYNNSFGHCGIATGKGDVNRFEAFVQNDPINYACRLQEYTYSSVLGWLHPIKLPQPMNDQQALIDSLKQESSHNLSLYNNLREGILKLVN